MFCANQKWLKIDDNRVYVNSYVKPFQSFLTDTHDRITFPASRVRGKHRIRILYKPSVLHHLTEVFTTKKNCWADRREADSESLQSIKDHVSA
jgi:hypothetical protein